MSGIADPPTQEPKFKWQDAFGLVGVLLAIGGMADMPLVLRLVCFLGCAICLPISFSSHKNWPVWARWALSIAVVTLMAFMSWSAYQKATESTGQAQISVTRIAGVFVINKNTHQQGFGLNVYYRNSGTAGTDWVEHRAVVITSESPLSSSDIEKDRQLARQANLPNGDEAPAEIEANSPELFFTTPGDDEGFVKMAIEARQVLAGKKRMYVFLTFKYRDQSLPIDKMRLTELCRWAEGNFEAWHLCGVNRTTVVSVKQP